MVLCTSQYINTLNNIFIYLQYIFVYVIMIRDLTKIVFEEKK